jgi:hypothetical protein
MSVASEITRLQTAKADLKTAIEGKGVTVPSSAKLDAYPALVDSISGGGYEENVWYFCCKDWANYLLILSANGEWETSETHSVKPRGTLCWFEFNGEKYYVDSFSDGNHTLTKEGAPVVCNISTFMTFSIRPSGSNFVLDVAED